MAIKSPPIIKPNRTGRSSGIVHQWMTFKIYTESLSQSLSLSFLILRQTRWLLTPETFNPKCGVRLSWYPEAICLFTNLIDKFYCTNIDTQHKELVEGEEECCKSYGGLESGRENSTLGRVQLCNTAEGWREGNSTTVLWECNYATLLKAGRRQQYNSGSGANAFKLRILGPDQVELRWDGRQVKEWGIAVDSNRIFRIYCVYI